MNEVISKSLKEIRFTRIVEYREDRSRYWETKCYRTNGFWNEMRKNFFTLLRRVRKCLRKHSKKDR